MARPDWLKLAEISRLWGEETGLDASSLQTDLEGWFAEFTKESTISRQFTADAPFDTIVANRLLGMLGARYLERRTFEFYCEERGYTKPRFWSHGQDVERVPEDLGGVQPRRRPIEPAAGTEAEVRALKKQLEAAQQNCAALRAENLANRRSWSGLQTSRPRRKRRSRVVLAAGSAVLLVALLAWGTETLIRRAGNEPIAQAGETAPAPSESVPASGNIPQLSSEQTAAPEAPESRAADAQAEVERLRADNAHLMDQLAKARASVESLREARQQSGETSGTSRQEPESAATASSVQVAVLETQLMSARRQIADLEKALEVATRLRGVAASQPPEAPKTAARSDPASAADQADSERADSTGYGAEIAEVLTGAELASDPVKTQTVALFDVVSSDDLLLDPGHYLGRQVVVTGSVMWLLRRYWLRSDDGQGRMVIDVDGLKPDDRYELENAVVNIETLAQVRARITGKIERRGADSYRLAATELMLAE